MAFHTPTVLAPAGTRIRAEFNGKTIADSRDVLLFRESPFKLFYYFPEESVDSSLIDRTSAETTSHEIGKLTTFRLRDGAKSAEKGAFSYSEPIEEFAALRGRIALDFSSMDRWFEEDEELLGHPRDPYTRIDVRKSSLHVEVLLEGRRLIDTRHPLILTETGLPLRYYVPSLDVDWSSLSDSDTHTVCPYKGKAKYWNAVVEGNEHPDVIWQYPEPLQDALLVRGAVGLYHERLELLIDGREPGEWPLYFSK